MEINKQTADSEKLGTQFRLDQLNQSLKKARKLGYQVRTEWLGGSAAGWCEIGGKKLLFVDLSLSVDEQLEQVELAIEAAKTGSTKDQGRAA